MGPPPTLVAPGLRTAVHTGWRSGVAWAVSVVVDQPSLWLLGALGYLLRGGVIVLTLAILVLPSPVGIRLMLGGYLGSSGLTPEFYVAAGVALLLLGVVAVLSMVLTAVVDVAAFERFVSRTARPDGATPSTPSRRARRQLIAALVLVQMAGLVVLLLAALPLLLAATQATYAELLRPSLAGGALYDRVLAQLTQPLLVLLLGLLLVEMVSALASRRLMARAFGLAGGSWAVGSHEVGSHEVGSGKVSDAPASVPRQALAALAAGLVRPIVRPFSTLPTALLGWLATLAVLLPLAWALPLVWRAVRSQFLAGPTVEALPALLLVTALLSLVWLAGLAVVGFASALRAGLWTSEELR